tara:strand:- start:85580 stop:87289 length:1710 start_codon:yes stop_codon:yes gene_type:complete
MKKVILIVTLCLFQFSFSQNLENHIPSNVQAVASINGDRLLELVSLTALENYSFVKKILKDIDSKDSTTVIKSLKDLGFNIDSKAYYFYQSSDSIQYHNFLIKLSDKNSFENLLSEYDKKRIGSVDGVSTLVEYSTVTMWNDSMLLFSTSESSTAYFTEHEERFQVYSEFEDEEIYSIKSRVIKKWIKKHTNDLFGNMNNTSILTNKEYVKHKNKKAAMSVWVNNYGELMTTAMSTIYGSPMVNTGLNPQAGMTGFESVSAHLFFDADQIKLTTDMEVSAELSKALKKMYNSKMDNAFFNYFNKNEALAYLSLSMNTQAIFEEYPNLMTSMYGGMLPDFKEEIKLSGDYLSLFLDEEAIGELVTGDVLFVLNDIGEKEIEYTSYEYDENFNRTETLETKNEVLPDFTLMIGSEKGKLLSRSVLLGVKHKVIESKSGYYKILAPKKEVPFDLFMAIKDDILFLTTSEDKIASIVRGGLKADSGKHEKLIKGSVSVMYVNGKELLRKVPQDELSSNEKGYFDFVNENFSEAYFKTAKIKKNQIVSEMIVNTPQNYDNALAFLFHFIETFAK